jgi:thiosulfate reductase cytochrome b subunit
MDGHPEPASGGRDSAAARPSSRKHARPRVDAPTFILHWGLVAAIGISLSTGLRIASDHTGSLASIPSRLLLPVLPEGSVIEWHVASSWLVTFIAIAYGIFMWRSGLGRRVAPNVIDARLLARARQSGRHAAAAWAALDRVLFQVAFALVATMAVTGWLLYNQTFLGLGMYWVATVHSVAAWALVGYVALHVTAVVKAGTFWKMLGPRPKHVLAGAAAALAAAALVGAAFVTDRQAHTTLKVPLVDAPPDVTGDGTHPAWSVARSATIMTARGANLPRGEVAVEVRAVHDGRFIYFRFRWDDPQRSQKMTPLLKTAKGWRVLQSGLDVNDENEYYEDKFAVILSDRPALGSGTTHLGQDLVSGPHYRNPRGLHYTEDGTVVDLWHWKSVRSGGMTPGYIDDNHIGSLLPPAAPGTRYTGGYTQDPPGAPHPYVQNWVKVDASAPLGRTLVLPLYVPRDPTILGRMGRIDLDPSAHDEGTWYLTIDEVVPYDPARDDYPIGTVLPGIVLEGVFEDDRAHVRAEARWAEGRWTLEAWRLLDTGSKYDIPFGRDRDVFLWVGVFNHTQTRHSQHLHPLRVVLE